MKIEKDVLLAEAQTMTIQELADRYGVKYSTMQKCLKKLNFKGRVGRPRLLNID